MRASIELEINSKHYDLDHSSSVIEIREIDEIRLVVKNHDTSCVYTALIEDYEVEFSDDDRDCLAITPGRYFSEAFGYSSIRVYESDQLLSELQFDIQAKKIHANQARKMIEYLIEQSNNSEIIQACLARSATPFGMSEGSKAEPEAILNCIEKLITIFHVSKKELLSNLRTRLIPTKQPITASSQNEADPTDVVSCLGSLISSEGLGDVIIRGRHYTLDNIDVLKLTETNDVKENQILLGGLYAAKAMIKGIDELLAGLPRNASKSIEGFESFSHLLLSLTASGLLLRCESLMQKIKALIYLFEKSLNVSYIGQLAPVITPFVRCSKIYKNLFSVIDELYALGKPDLGNVKALMKLKSLSKIYEIYCFYHLLNFFHKSGFQLTSARPHESLGALIPSQVTFERGDLEFVVSYEQKIHMFNEFTRHMDLVRNHYGKTYKYYEPDFLINLKYKKQTRFFVLDAKYSTAYTVKNERIPELFRKYYDGISVYDAENNFFTNSMTMAVLALYPLAESSPRYISYWPRQGLFNSVPRIPVIGGVALTIDSDLHFEETLIKTFELAGKTFFGEKYFSWSNNERLAI